MCRKNLATLRTARIMERSLYEGFLKVGVPLKGDRGLHLHLVEV